MTQINISIIPGRTSGDLNDFIGRVWTGIDELDGDVFKISVLNDGIFASTCKLEGANVVSKIYKFNNLTSSFEEKYTYSESSSFATPTSGITNFVDIGSGIITLVSWSSERVLKSVDGGDNFSQINIFGGGIRPDNLLYDPIRDLIYIGGFGLYRMPASGASATLTYDGPIGERIFGCILNSANELILTSASGYSSTGVRVKKIIDPSSYIFNPPEILYNSTYKLATPPVKDENGHIFFAAMIANSNGSFLIYKSIDDGNSFDIIYSGEFGDQIENSFISTDPTNGYFENKHGYLLPLNNNQLLLFGPKILRSQDGGASWSVVQDGSYWRWGGFAYSATVVAGKNSIPAADNIYQSFS